MTGYPCCCDAGATACANCDDDTTPGSITATFGAGTNSTGDESECAGDCDDFDSLGPWELPQLSQAQIDTLNSSCSAAFIPGSPVAGCFYGLTVGLPCGCDAMILEVTDGGTSGPGAATGVLTMCWGGTKWATITWEINTDDTDQDCLTNIDTAGGGVDNAGNAIGTTYPECDFVNIIFDFTLLDLVANA